MQIIEATAMLHNIGIRWGDTMERDLYPEAPPGMPPTIDDVIVLDETPLDRATRLRQGKETLQVPISNQELRHLRNRRN